MSYPLTCDTCGTSGTVDDGIEIGGPCQYEECDGTIHGQRFTYTIVIECEDRDQADAVIAARCGCDEEVEDDYGQTFDYRIVAVAS